jgi:DNA-binding GntR family transcriptional regulator
VSTDVRRAGAGVGRPRGTGSQRVYQRIREKILRLDLAPGADLDEAGLEREFSLSRTPVREALIKLASEGLVTLLPNKGARVSALDVAEVPEMLEALELLHRACLRFAAERREPAALDAMRRANQAFGEAAGRGDYDRMGDANTAFHMATARCAGNRYLERVFDGLLSASLRLARLSFAAAGGEGDRAPVNNQQVFDDHEAMIDAVERGDVEVADRLAREHVAVFRERVRRYLSCTRAADMPMEARGR